MSIVYSLVFVFILIFIIQVFFFAIAAVFKTDKVTDLAYGLSFVVVAWYELFKNNLFNPFSVILVAMVSVWGFRLAIYLFYRILKIKKDSRFNEIRSNFVKLAGFWIIQTVSIFIISLAYVVFFEVFDPTDKISVVYTAIGFLIWVLGFSIEAISDKQKWAYLSSGGKKWIDSGLWKYSRHPNYFGEILCWVGIYVYTLSSTGITHFYTMLSPIFITLLLLFFSGIPLLEKAQDEKFGNDTDYINYKKNTSLLIIWPPKS